MHLSYIFWTKMCSILSSRFLLICVFNSIPHIDIALYSCRCTLRSPSDDRTKKTKSVPLHWWQIPFRRITKEPHATKWSQLNQSINSLAMTSNWSNAINRIFPQRNLIAANLHMNELRSDQTIQSLLIQHNTKRQWIRLFIYFDFLSHRTRVHHVSGNGQRPTLLSTCTNSQQQN